MKFELVFNIPGLFCLSLFFLRLKLSFLSSGQLFPLNPKKTNLSTFHSGWLPIKNPYRLDPALMIGQSPHHKPKQVASPIPIFIG